MTWLAVLDPAEMDRRFAAPTPDVASDLELSPPALSPADLAALIDRLPPREADVIDLCVRRGKKQQEAATLLGISQPSVGDRLRRAVWRMRELTRERPSEDSARLALVACGLCTADVETAVVFARTSNKMATGRIVGVSEGEVRRRVRRAVEKLLELASDAATWVPVGRRREWASRSLYGGVASLAADVARMLRDMRHGSLTERAGGWKLPGRGVEDLKGER